MKPKSSKALKNATMGERDDSHNRFETQEGICGAENHDANKLRQLLLFFYSAKWFAAFTISGSGISAALIF